MGRGRPGGGEFVRGGEVGVVQVACG
jgi:hypothetical protein